MDPKKKTASIHALSGKVKKVGEDETKSNKNKNGGGDVGFSYSGGGEVDATSFSMNTKNSVSWSSRFVTFVPPSRTATDRGKTSSSQKRKDKMKKKKQNEEEYDDQEGEGEEIEEIEMITLNAHLKMEISMAKPAWILGPQSLVDRVGNMVLAQVLKVALPDFLKRMKAGYLEWSERMNNTKEGKKMAKKKGHNGRRIIKQNTKTNSGLKNKNSHKNNNIDKNNYQSNETTVINSNSKKKEKDKKKEKNNNNSKVTAEKASTKTFWKLL